MREIVLPPSELKQCVCRTPMQQPPSIPDLKCIHTLFSISRFASLQHDWISNTGYIIYMYIFWWCSSQSNSFLWSGSSRATAGSRKLSSRGPIITSFQLKHLANETSCDDLLSAGWHVANTIFGALLKTYFIQFKRMYSVYLFNSTNRLCKSTLVVAYNAIISSNYITLQMWGPRKLYFTPLDGPVFDAAGERLCWTWLYFSLGNNKPSTAIVVLYYISTLYCSHNFLFCYNYYCYYFPFLFN